MPAYAADQFFRPYRLRFIPPTMLRMRDACRDCRQADCARRTARFHAARIRATARVSAVDGRQSASARLRHGAREIYATHSAFACVSRVSERAAARVGPARRLVALGGAGEIWIVEIKSSIADFRADQQMERLSPALRPAVLRHHGRRRLRDIFPPDAAPDRRRCRVALRVACEAVRQTPAALPPRASMSLAFRGALQRSRLARRSADPEAVLMRA